MRKLKLTPGFIGGIIGLALGILISFGANVAIRASYNHTTAEFDSSKEIDPLGLTYRSLLNQDSEPDIMIPDQINFRTIEDAEVEEVTED